MPAAQCWGDAWVFRGLTKVPVSRLKRGFHVADGRSCLFPELLDELHLI
jgi:hypothetical protein